jgi:tetratricopeptide (TPR) repeat protein
MVRPVSAPVPAARDRRDITLIGLSLAVVGWAVYINSLTNPFVYDDYRLIVENAALTDPRNLQAVVWHDVSRPVVNLTYALDAALWGLRPLGFHLTNVLLHAFNVLLVFVVARGLDADSRAHRSRGVDGDPTQTPARRCTGAIVGAGLFAVHPLLSQAVGYVSARADLLCATFVLVAFLAARRYLKGASWAWAAMAAGAWLLALGSKEVAAMLPVVLLVYHALLLPRGTSSGRALRLYLPMFGLVVFAVGVRVWLLRQVEYQSAPLDWRLALVAVGAVGSYFRLLLWPSGQTIFHALTAIESWHDVRALLALGFLAAGAWVAWWLRRVDRTVPFGAAWFVLFLLPSSALFVLGRGEALAEHRVYLPSVGIFLAGAALFAAAIRRTAIETPAARWLLVGLATVAMLQLGARTMIRNAVWSDPVALWQESVARAPEHWLPHMMLAETLRQRQGCEAAVPEYERSIHLRPEETFAYTKLGACLTDLRRYDEATAVFAALVRVAPASAAGPTGLALVAMMQGHPEQSRAQLMEGIRREPSAVMPRQLLAVLEAPDDPATALRLCREIRQLAPATPGNDACIQENEQRLARATTPPATRDAH